MGQMSSFNRQRHHYLDVYCTRPADERILAFERELDFGVCMMFRCLAIVHAADTPRTPAEPKPSSSSRKHALPHALTKHLSRRSVQTDAAKVRASPRSLRTSGPANPRSAVTSV